MCCVVFPEVLFFSTSVFSWCMRVRATFGRHHSTKVEDASLTMLSVLKSLLPKPRMRDVAALQHFLEREAAHLAQRSVIDFARNELGSLSAQAFSDDRFQAKLAVCRWEGFAATLADMVVLAHARLLDAGTPRAVLDRRMGDLYAAILEAHHVPEIRPDGWGADVAALRKRLAERTDGAVDPQADAEATGRKVFNTLPFEPRDPKENRMVLANAFAFGLIAFNDGLRRLLVAAPVRDELSAGATP